jgi:hypothetical protein
MATAREVRFPRFSGVVMFFHEVGAARRLQDGTRHEHEDDLRGRRGGGRVSPRRRGRYRAALP